MELACKVLYIFLLWETLAMLVSYKKSNFFVYSKQSADRLHSFPAHLQ